MADLLSSFGLSRLAQGSGSSGNGGPGLPPSSSMLQLLAALDSPTGRLSEGLAYPPQGGEGASEGIVPLPLPSNGSFGSLPFTSSSSMNNLRSLLRSASSQGNLADLVGEGTVEQQIHNFAALARNASLHASTTGAAAGAPGSSHNRSPSVHGGGRAAELAGAASANLGGVWGDGENMLLPGGGAMKESPSVSSLVDLVRSSSATSLVELMHSYSANNLAALVRDDPAHES